MRALVSALRRRFGVFLAVLGGVVGVTLLVVLARPARYTATAEVALGASGERAAPGSPDGGALSAADRANTEARIIRSRAMARDVAASLHLDQDPAFAAPGGLSSRLARIVGAHAPAAPPREELVGQVADRLLDRLAVAHPADTYALTISYTAADPQAAARIANAFAEHYSARQPASGPGAPPPDRPPARIISSAEPPLAPSTPAPLMSLTLAVLAGSALGLAAAVVAERMFAGITGGDDIEARLGLHHLGSVPMLASVLPAAGSALDAVVEAPMSAFAEAFRSVLMAVRHIGGRGTQVIAISSALPNEGKTTIAACLARTVALAGDSVVLVDCDARRRDASAMFAQAGTRPGLAELLRLEATLDEVLIRDEASGAWILPLTGPPADLSDLIAGAAMDEVIAQLRRRFKRVLIDTAPILAISDTRAIATMADLVVVVVRWRATADHAVNAALRLFPREHVRIGGVVLSQVDMTKQAKHGRGDPSFYYKQYSDYYS